MKAWVSTLRITGIETIYKDQNDRRIGGRDLSTISLRSTMFYIALTCLLLPLMMALVRMIFFRDLPPEIASSSAMEIVTTLMRVDGMLLSFTVAFAGLISRQLKREKFLALLIFASIFAYSVALVFGFRAMIIAADKEYIDTRNVLFPFELMIAALFLIVASFLIARQVPENEEQAAYLGLCR